MAGTGLPGAGILLMTETIHYFGSNSYFVGNSGCS